MSKRYCPNRSEARQKGFSFIEVLLAVALLAFLVVGVLGMTSTQVSSNSYLRHHASALQLAEAGMELLNRVDYNTALAGYNGVIETAIVNYPGYQREFVVNWGTELTALRVVVFWQKGGVNSARIVLNSQRTR